MKIKLNSNMITGIIFLIVSLVMYILLPSEIKTYETGTVTAQTVPKLLIICMLICSSVLLVQGLISKNKKEYVISKALFNKENLIRLKPVIYIGMILLYAIILPIIGFIIASLLLVNGILVYFRVGKWWFYAIASANVLVAFFAFQAMGVTLP